METKLKEAMQRVRAYLQVRAKKPQLDQSEITSIEMMEGSYVLTTSDLRALVDALAERAVSPPESVQSVDGTRFRTLLWEFQRDAMSVARINLLIEHIDASRASAQAEGRRSAMEELAEVREASAYLAADAKDHSSRVQILLDRIAELEAARQAPDLSREEIIALIVRDVAELDYDGSEIDKMEVTPIDLTAILDSRLAQPLQQEGGKEVDTYAAKRLRLIATKLGLGSAIPESDEELWGCAFSVLGMIRRKVEELLAQPSDNLQQASTAQVEPAKECGNCFEGKTDMDHACRACGGTGVATTAVKEAASATDAEQERRYAENTAFHKWWKESGHAADATYTLTMENCAHAVWQARAELAAENEWLADRLGKLLAGVAVALKGPEPARKRWSYHDLPEIAAKAMLEIELHRAKEAAQATPEGADLLQDERAAFEAWQRKDQGWLYNNEAEEGTFQEDRWIAWQARAALAATTAVEPQQPDYSANSDHRIMQVDDNGMPM